MIRTLLIIAAVSFVFAVGCLSGAVAVAGGLFRIGPGLNFERTVKVCRVVHFGDHQVRNCRWASPDDGDDDGVNTVAANAQTANVQTTNVQAAGGNVAAGAPAVNAAGH